MIHMLDTDASHGPGTWRSRYQETTVETTTPKNMDVPRAKRDRNANVSRSILSIVGWLYLFGEDRLFEAGE